MKKLLLGIIVTILLSSLDCRKNEYDNYPSQTDYKELMRKFVIGISKYSKHIYPNFIIIPQNGIELMSSNGEINGNISTEYSNAIDGNGQEDLFFGYENDNEATPSETVEYLNNFLNLSKNDSNTILVTDYCSDHSKMDISYSKNNDLGYISFAANHRGLDNIPDYPEYIMNSNSNDINKLSDIKNFLYIINPENYSNKSDFINAIKATNYDLIIMDLFFNNGTMFTAPEIKLLKKKPNGSRRLVISYMSIGEAENYRYYWKDSWNKDKPFWMDEENPNWAGNYKVKYWEKEWQDIIYGNNDSYIKKIMNAGFDGAYLDIIDAFEYYESK